MRIRAYAKINLTLDILSKRPDGYHDISSVMQTLTLADDLDIELTDSGGDIRLTVDGPYAGGAPANPANLVNKAAQAILATADSRRGVAINLTKNIPVQAGLGGGSSDAAATLRCVNNLLGKPFTMEELLPIAVKLGADVPFFLYGGTCLVEGIGERIIPLGSPITIFGIIAKPPCGVSTKAAYDALDLERGMAIKSGSQGWDGKSLRNDFEAVIFDLYPEIALARKAMLKAGCEQVVLCGSGSALFGSCGRERGLSSLEREVHHSNVGTVWKTSTINTDQIGCGS